VILRQLGVLGLGLLLGDSFLLQSGCFAVFDSKSHRLGSLNHVCGRYLALLVESDHIARRLKRSGLLIIGNAVCLQCEEVVGHENWGLKILQAPAEVDASAVSTLPTWIINKELKWNAILRWHWEQFPAPSTVRDFLDVYAVVASFGHHGVAGWGRPNVHIPRDVGRRRYTKQRPLVRSKADVADLSFTIAPATGRCWGS
jgi:hypothetical protein